MSVTIPDSHKDLIEGPVYAVLTTLMPDGRPQSTVVWANTDGQHVLVNTAAGRQKDKNMRANPMVSLVAIDPQNPYRWIEVRGEVAEMTENGGVEHINELARLYVNAPEYYGHAAPEELRGKETRVKIKVRPVKVTTFGE